VHTIRPCSRTSLSDSVPLVANPIPHLEVERKFIHDFTAFYVSTIPNSFSSTSEDTFWRSTSRKSRGLGFATTSSHVRERHEKVLNGYDALRDIFMTRCHTGVRVSPFFAEESELRSVLTLHGLQSSASCTRDLRIALLNHLLNGDCFGSQCLSSNHVTLDRTACLCIAEGFSSSLAITECVCKLLQDAPSTTVSTDSLMLVVTSVGCQGPYENRMHLRRRVLKSLETFLVASREKNIHTSIDNSIDPFGDLFVGFENMPKPALMTIMDRHCILTGQRKHLSRDDMQAAIISHIADGHCVRSTPESRIAHLIGSKKIVPDVNSDIEISTIPTCEEFVCYVGMSPNISDIDTRVRTLTFMCDSLARKPMLRLLRDQNIEHVSTASLKGLRFSLKKYINVLKKSNRDVPFEARATRRHTKSIAAQWPSAVPQALKDQLIANFREETSSDYLKTYVCASCSESDYDFNKIEVEKSELDLSVLQVPPGHQSAMHSMAHLDITLKSQGILVDSRGICTSKSSTLLTLCKECHSHLRRGKIPPLSMANDVIIGEVPRELCDLTIVEEAMIARCRSKCWVLQLKAENQDISIPNT